MHAALTGIAASVASRPSGTRHLRCAPRYGPAAAVRAMAGASLVCAAVASIASVGSASNAASGTKQPGLSSSDDSPPLHRGGIDVRCLGNLNVDFASEQLYHDAAVDGTRTLAIKANTPIVFEHNDRNSIQMMDTGSGDAVQWDSAPAAWNVTKDSGIIRYRIDRDLNWKYHWSPGVPTPSKCGKSHGGPPNMGLPAAQPGTSITLGSEVFPDGVQVVGGIGSNVAENFSNPDVRGEFFWRGVEDLHGDEWHTLTFGDDDSLWRSEEECTEFGDRLASDGGHQELIVNPKTPTLTLANITATAQWYTTPPKAYFIPRIYHQTTYLTDGVEIRFVNIMTTDPVLYRLNSSSDWVKFNPDHPLLSSTLPDGRTTLQYYYNKQFIRNRTLIKNPPHASAGETHGSLWWADTAERDRMLFGNSSGRRAVLEQLATAARPPGYPGNTSMDRRFGKALRAGSASFANALLGVIEGWDNPETRHGYYAKRSLLDNAMLIDLSGNELYDQATMPSKEKTFYGYYEVNRVYAYAGTYDLLAAHFRSDQYPGGLTAVEDLKARDVLAGRVHQTLGELTGLYNEMYCTEWKDKNASTGVCVRPIDNVAPDPTLQVGMWDCARLSGALVALWAMPSYSTPFYGTAGADFAPARYPWTPAREPTSWMDMLVTRLDGSQYFTEQLRSFPSQRRLWNQLDGGLITNESDPWGAGNWYDRAGYFGYPLVGHTMQVSAHMLLAKLDLHLPLLETAFNRSLNGVLRPHKYPDEFAHEFYPSVLLVNPRFSDLAPQAIRNLNDSTFQSSHNITGDAANLGKNLYIAGILAALWYDPDFVAHPVATAECGDGKRTGREPCDGDDFGDLGTAECKNLNDLYTAGKLVCHRCRIVTVGCSVVPLDKAVAGGIR